MLNGGEFQARPLRYSITNLPAILAHVDRRSYFYRKMTSLLNRKAAMDLNYSTLLHNLLQKQSSKEIQQGVASQFFYKTLVDTLLEEASRMQNLGMQTKEQVQKMASFSDQGQPENKKLTSTLNTISKELAMQQQKVEKSRSKFEKRRKQLQSTKLQYITSLLSKEQLRKNELYLSLSSLEDTVRPLRDDHQAQCDRYNKELELMLNDYREAQYKLEISEHKKIILMKEVLGSYLQIQKNSLDATLRDNPFRKASIDRVSSCDEIATHVSVELNEQVQKMVIPFTDESEYIDRLYERIEVSKSLQEIVLYGQQPEHKQSISELYAGEQVKPEAVAMESQDMIHLFRIAFNHGQSWNAQRDEEIRKLLLTAEVRKDFILCLQKFRIKSEFELPLANMDSILAVIKAFMDVCDAQQDTYNSKMLMVLSLTYYFIMDESKLELQELVKSHPIWHRVGWWQAALLESVFEESRFKMPADHNSISIWDIKAGGVSCRKEGEETTHQHICFNNLVYYVSNMGLFGLPNDRIYAFAKNNIQLFRFNPRMAKDVYEQCPIIQPSP